MILEHEECLKNIKPRKQKKQRHDEDASHTTAEPRPSHDCAKVLRMTGYVLPYCRTSYSVSRIITDDFISICYTHIKNNHGSRISQRVDIPWSYQLPLSLTNFLQAMEEVELTTVTLAEYRSDISYANTYSVLPRAG